MLSDANTEKRHVLKCRCGCGIITFEKEDKYYDENVVFIEYYPIAFYALQHPLWERIKAIWNLIRGKEYRLYEVVANYEDLKLIVDMMEKNG